MNLAELVATHAEERPGHPAVVLGEDTVTYSELDASSAKVGAWLLGAGVGRGDRVLFYSENSIEFLASYLATARIGAIFAPVHPSFKAQEMSYVLANADPGVVFVSARLAKEFHKFLSGDSRASARRVIVVGEGYSGPWESFRDVLKGDGEVPITDVDADDPVLISYTSGSTAAPKPVVRSHGGEIWSARTYVEVWDYRSTDRALIALPLTWAYGISTTTTALFAAGATVVLLSHFNPVRVLEAIERASISLFAGSSTMLVKMLDVYRRSPSDLSSLRNCYVGAEPINRAVVAEFERLVGGRIWEGYAATEAFPVLATMPQHDSGAPTDTAGRLVPGARLRLVDAQGREVPDGEVGEAQFTCPGRMVGYFGELGLTRERLTEDGWVRSGDLLRCDENGYYFVVGRLSDMIIRGGANIAPSEVENAIVSVPGILDATVVSVPDQANGEAVVAFITTTDGQLDETGIRQLLRIKLASYKIPERFFVDVTPPSGGNGKKDRRAAAALARELVARS